VIHIVRNNKEKISAGEFMAAKANGVPATSQWNPGRWDAWFDKERVQRQV